MPPLPPAGRPEARLFGVEPPTNFNEHFNDMEPDSIAEQMAAGPRPRRLIGWLVEKGLAGTEREWLMGGN